jgi:hypothetical protein
VQVQDAARVRVLPRLPERIRAAVVPDVVIPDRAVERGEVVAEGLVVALAGDRGGSSPGGGGGGLLTGQPVASTCVPGGVPGQVSLESGTPSPSESAGGGGVGQGFVAG